MNQNRYAVCMLIIEDIITINIVITIFIVQRSKTQSYEHQKSAWSTSNTIAKFHQHRLHFSKYAHISLSGETGQTR